MLLTCNARLNEAISLCDNYCHVRCAYNKWKRITCLRVEYMAATASCDDSLSTLVEKNKLLYAMINFCVPLT